MDGSARKGIEENGEDDEQGDEQYYEGVVAD